MDSLLRIPSRFQKPSRNYHVALLFLFWVLALAEARLGQNSPRDTCLAGKTTFDFVLLPFLAEFLTILTRIR
jgi:hypothetical protein